MKSEEHAFQDVQKRPGRKKRLYPEGQRYKGHMEEINGLEDGARQVQKSRGQ